MQKTILFLVTLVVVVLATSPVVLSNAPKPLTTEELLWDNGISDKLMGGNVNRAVWFVMPFDAQIVTARILFTRLPRFQEPALMCYFVPAIMRGCRTMVCSTILAQSPPVAVWQVKDGY